MSIFEEVLKTALGFLKEGDTQGLVNLLKFYAKADYMCPVEFVATTLIYDEGWTLLHHAAYENKTEILTALNEPEMYSGVAMESWHELKMIALTTADSQSNAPLHIAAQQGHIQAVDWFFCQGVSLDLIGQHSYTAHMIAAFFGHLELMKYLVVPKADGRRIFPNLQGKGGNTAVHLAVWGDHDAVLDVLLEKFRGHAPRPFTITNDQRMTPCQLAALIGSEKCMRVFKKRGIKPS